jgi:hypothetical protein
MAHSAKPTTHPADTFTDEELEALKKEPMLVVVEGEEGEAKKAAPTKSPQTNNEPMITKPENIDELMSAIVKAIGELNKETDFTQAGTPRVNSVVEKLGYDVSGDEVSTAYEQYKKDNE